MKKNKEQILERLFRTEYGKLIATVIRFFGPTHIQQAEDIVQDALITALNHWGVDGIPDNPTAWLMQVAKRKALNELKRSNSAIQHQYSIKLGVEVQGEEPDVFLENEIEDSQLRMIFTCCHPSINRESQIALILRTLCGFGIGEVANALLTSTSTINKRLFRAKKSIRDSEILFSIPQGSELEERLETVCLTLYLLFNEGYNSSSSTTIIRRELCLEAMRLCKLVVEHFPEHKKSLALLALMCFHTARFDARIDDHGAIILFEDQDRGLWNKDLIHLGMQYFQRSLNDKSLSTYHLEAGIAAEHCLAENFQTTNWQSIYEQYRHLEKLKPSPIIAINLAIIQSKTEGIEASLKALDILTNEPILATYHLLPATQGVFHLKLGNYRKAISYLNQAMQLTTSSIEKNFMENKIEECKNRMTAL